MDKKIGKFGVGQSVQKLPENKGKMFFYETYFEESNISRKPMILSKYKIMTIYDEIWTKIMGEFDFWQSVRKLPKN